MLGENGGVIQSLKTANNLIISLQLGIQPAISQHFAPQGLLELVGCFLVGFAAKESAVQAVW